MTRKWHQIEFSLSFVDLRFNFSSLQFRERLLCPQCCQRTTRRLFSEAAAPTISFDKVLLRPNGLTAVYRRLGIKDAPRASKREKDGIFFVLPAESQLLQSVPVQSSHTFTYLHMKSSLNMILHPPHQLGAPDFKSCGGVIFIAASDMNSVVLSLSPPCSSPDRRLVQEAAADSEPGRESRSGRLLLILPGRFVAQR